MIIFKRIEDRKPLFPFSDNECQSDGSSEVAGFDLKDESAEEEADLLKDVLNDIDDTMVDTTAADDHESKMCQMIKDEFKAESLTDLFTSFHGIQKEVGLMVLQQAVPRLT